MNSHNHALTTQTATSGVVTTPEVSRETLQFDEAVAGVEVRDLEQRLIYGRIIPYGERITVRGRPESFTRGALAGLDPTETILLRDHDRRRPIGRMIALEERDDGAYGTFRVPRTPDGDEALTLAAEGVLNALSPGFVAGMQSRDGTHRQVSALPEVSLLPWGAYRAARVLAVRESEAIVPETMTPPAPPAVDLGPIETRLGELATQLTEVRTLVDAPPASGAGRGPTPFQWFVGELQAVVLERYERREAVAASIRRALETRALEDVTGTLDPDGTGNLDASGLVAEDYLASQLVNVLDSRRPLFASMGSFTMPRSGYARIPVVTQHTEVGARAGQKLPANSRKLIVVTKSFEAEWYDGAVDVALEVIRSAELPVLEMVWQDLLGQYAISTEAGLVAFVNGLAAATGFTYTGTVLSTTTYAAFAAQVATAAITVRTNSGAPATKLAVTAAQWPLLVSMVDADGRRQFGSSASAEASADLNSESFQLPGGIDVFYAPGITKAMLYNQSSLRVSDGGPERVEATNVELMGRDIGLLGRTMIVPRIPSAVVVFGVGPT